MSNRCPPVSRLTVQAFYQAYATRDIERLTGLIDDHVEWVITGPVELMDFCGTHHGKAAVLALFSPQVPAKFEVTGFAPEALLIDGDRAAMLGRLSGVRRDNGNRIGYQLAHFVRFRDDRVVEFRSLIDSFDAAEQLLGHVIDLSGAGTASRHDIGGRIVI